MTDAHILLKWPNPADTTLLSSDYALIVGDGATGNQYTASLLQMLAATLANRQANGVVFDGSRDVTVPASAVSLYGPTLSAAVKYSSLVSVGILDKLHVTTLTVDSGGADVTGNSTVRGNLTVLGAAPVVFTVGDGTRTSVLQGTGGSGAIANGLFMQMTTAHGLTLVTANSVGQKIIVAYVDTGASTSRSALEVAATNGFATLDLMLAGGTVRIGGKALTFGAADSGGAGFRTVTIAN